MRIFVLFLLVVLCLVVVNCDKRRDVHRIVLKSARNKHKSHSKKTPNRPKPHHFHNHHEHEPHATSIHEETVIPHHYHHQLKERPTFLHEYRDLVKPRPPIRQEVNFPEEELESYRQSLYKPEVEGYKKANSFKGEDYRVSYKPEGEIVDYRPSLYKAEGETVDYRQSGLFKQDGVGWAPVTKQNLVSHHASADSSPSYTISYKTRKTTRKPIVDTYVEFTTAKPQFFQQDSYPAHFEHYATFNKVHKPGKRPTRLHNSYEVHEETDEVQPEPQKGFNNLAPITYSFRENVVPTADTFSQDTFGVTVKGGRKSTRRPY